MRVTFAAPIVAVVMPLSLVVVMEVLRLELDRLAVWGAVGGAVPGVLIARKVRRVGHALFGDEPFERIEPVVVIGLAGVRVAGGLRAFDLIGERRSPFG